MTRILAGDLGGTKTLLRLVDVSAKPWKVERERRFESDRYASFTDVLLEFLRDKDDGAVARACFGVAGPVVHGTASLTNLSWVLDPEELQRVTGIASVRIINDFHAVALAVPWLGPEDVVTLQPGTRAEGAPMAVIGAGTGLGEATLVVGGGSTLVMPSEGGHCDFAPGDDEQLELLRFLMRRHGHVSWERVVSGMGIANIARFLRERHYAADHRYSWLDVADDDLPPLVAERAASGDPLADRAMNLFVDAYGAEAGNLALKVLARGGVYVAGGIGAKNVDRMTGGRFISAFVRKGRFESLMREIPVHLVVNEEVGVLGAVAGAMADA